MSRNSDELVVAASGDVYLANLAGGVVLPGDEDVEEALDAAFAQLGYATEDGVTLTAGQTVEGIPAWQSPTDIRRLVTARTLRVAFQLLQWNEENFGLAFGGGEWSEPTPGTFRYDPPGASDALAEYALVVDWQDGDKKYRLVLKRGTVADEVETNLIRTGASVLPITYDMLTPDDEATGWYLVTNDPAYEAGS